ncbi:MAG TPA: hypothetical protein VM821_07880, partial [Abditibacteriaceae bacterium]|nr:hypothetical protein [Abditibacteriaceae bacterium]
MDSTFLYQHREPKISIVLATPHAFKDIALTVAHWRAQTVQRDVELVLVAESLSKLAIPDGAVDGFAAVLWVKSTRQETLGEARAQGARQSRAPLIGFSEDHAFPEPQWAQAMIDAHQNKCTAVGPVVINFNPHSLVSRADFLIGYGPWDAAKHDAGHAVGHEVELLPGHNSCYKREALLRYDADLGTLLQAETVLYWRLREDGETLWLEPRARLHHTNFSLWKTWLQVQVHHGRLFGSTRAAHWSRGKRAFYARASPLIPFVRLARVLRFSGKGTDPR